MKKSLLIPLFTFTFCLHLSAAVPLRWTVETSRATPATFEAYQGETLELEAALQSYGKPLEAPSDYSLFWQTNGMGNVYWEVKLESEVGVGERNNSNLPLQLETPTNNILRATWSPTNDVGAKVYNCFIGKPGTIYHAAFQLRLRPSPGALPNVLPLPVPVIDFAKVRVLNPPWEGGGGGVDGAARPLPAYLHALDFDDSYPEAAEEYYRQRLDFGGCSAVRSGGFLSRNFDYPFDDRAEFVVKMSAGNGRFASVGVAQVGTNLTEQIVTSGKPSRWYKSLPGATVDGINENGVVAEINVVDTPVTGWHTTGDLHPLAAVRWVLDHATNAQHAATYIAANIRFPSGWTQNFHYMIADAEKTYIVENGADHLVPSSLLEGAVMTNFRLYGDPKDTTGEGQERYIALTNGANITSQWWTLTYTPDGYRASDLPGITGEALTQLFDYWASKPREAHRSETFNSQFATRNSQLSWWQTVHTSIYDIPNRVLRVAVQETDDWYTFAVPSAGGIDYANVRAKALNSAQYHEYGYPFLGRQDLMVKDAMVVGTTNYAQRAQHTEYCDGTIQNEARDCYLYLPHNKSGDIAVEDPFEIVALIDIASTNATARASLSAKVMSVIDAAVEAKITTALAARRIRTYDDVRHCWWVCDVVNGVPTWTVEE